MAFAEYKLVIDSDLYHGQAGTRSLLLRIAMLIRRGDSPMTGYCTARQETLAKDVGMTVRGVEKSIRQFKKDKLFSEVRNVSETPPKKRLWYKLNLEALAKRKRIHPY